VSRDVLTVRYCTSGPQVIDYNMLRNGRLTQQEMGLVIMFWF